MSDEQIQASRPRPYRVDGPIHKVQTVVFEEDSEDTKFVVRHDFARLDASNVGLLLDREKKTKRITEKLGKGRSRPRFNQTDANKVFYSALVQGGGWRPYGLEPFNDEKLIPPSVRSYYSLNSDTNLWVPGWTEMDRTAMLGLTPEKMGDAIDRWLACKGKSISTGTIDFMFEKGGIMKVSLAIGDSDNPAYKLLFELRRPESKRRTKFKDDFAYAIDNSKGEMGNIETIIDLRQGINFFDEYFLNAPDDPEYSQIVFEDKRGVSITEPPADPGSVVEAEKDPVFIPRPYSDDLRDQLISYINPHFKVEVAAAAVQSFSQTDQE